MRNTILGDSSRGCFQSRRARIICSIVFNTGTLLVPWRLFLTKYSRQPEHGKQQETYKKHNNYMRRKISQTRDSLEFVKEVVQYEYFPNMRKFREKDASGKRRRRFPSLFPFRRRSPPFMDPITEYDDAIIDFDDDVTESTEYFQQSHAQERKTENDRALQQSRTGYEQALDVISRALLLVLPTALLSILNSRYHRKQKVIVRSRRQHLWRKQRQRRRPVPPSTPMLRRRRFTKVAAVEPAPVNKKNQHTTHGPAFRRTRVVSS